MRRRIPAIGRLSGAAAVACALSVVFGALAGCDPIYLSEPRFEQQGALHDAPITASETWRAADNPHTVTGSVIVAGSAAPTLTLEPGVRILFARGAELRIGSDTSPGALQALGTAARPVTLMAESQIISPGYWRGITFGKAAAPSHLEHVSIRDCGGGERFPVTCISMVGFDTGGPHPVMKDVDIRFSRGFGVVALSGAGFGAGSANLTIQDVNGFPVRIDPNAAGSLPRGGTYTSTSGGAIFVPGGRVTKTQIWPDLGVPYLITDFLYVFGPEAPVLTLEAGNVLQFAAKSQMVVGSATEPGALIAEGTTGNAVIFTAVEQVIDYWRGITFGHRALPSTRLSNILIEYGGFPADYAEANLAFARDLGPVVRNSLIRYSGGCGIVRLLSDSTVWTTDFTDPVLGNTFQGNANGHQCTQALP